MGRPPSVVDPPVNSTPIALAPPTFARHESATRYVEGAVRTRAPRRSLERSPGIAPGAWGILPVGKTITGRDGDTLGTGTVELYQPSAYDPAYLTDQAESVTVYNGFGPIRATREFLVIPLLWINGFWIVVDPTAPAAGDAYGPTAKRCECPNPPYEIEIRCDCNDAYGALNMPRFWWLTLSSASVYGDGSAYCSHPCASFVPALILLQVETDVYGHPTCVWTGRDKARCTVVELSKSGSSWILTITDSDSCVLAVLKADAFDCCGINTSWATLAGSACNFAVILAPHECTCCSPPKLCPPPDVSLCPDATCCLDNYESPGHAPGPICSVQATVNGLANYPATQFSYPPPDERCNCMNGIYQLAWSKKCTWENTQHAVNTISECQGTDPPIPLANPVVTHATMTVSGSTVTLTLQGDTGQTATFVKDNWDCGFPINLIYQGGTCDDREGPTAVIAVP